MWRPSLSPVVGAQYFDSADDLASKLRSTDLYAVSAAMAQHSREMLPAMQAKWRTVLHQLFQDQQPGSWPSRGGFDEALSERFGLQLPAEEPDCERQSAPEQGSWK